MELSRDDALARLRGILGHDLRALANSYGVTVFKNSKPNKGWSGQTLERFLGLPTSSSRDPDGGDWELKTTPVVCRKGRLVPKETIAVTMLDSEVARTPFERSHVYQKLRRLIVCGRLFVSKTEPRAPLLVATKFDLEGKLLEEIRADYETVRQILRTRGFDSLSGALGVWIQPRTKGPGHGSKTRAFYARTRLVARMLDLDSLSS